MKKSSIKTELYKITLELYDTLSETQKDILRNNFENLLQMCTSTSSSGIQIVSEVPAELGAPNIEKTPTPPKGESGVTLPPEHQLYLQRLKKIKEEEKVKNSNVEWESTGKTGSTNG